MAQSFIGRQCLQLNKNMFRVKIRAKNVGITFAATFLLVCLSNDSFTDFIPNVFEILMDKDLTS